MAQGPMAQPTLETMLLERTAEQATLSASLKATVDSGSGRVVLIGGEAGVGKTALIRAFTGELDGRRVHWGACDALFTPRPLGPFHEIAEGAGGELEELVASEAKPHQIAAALATQLSTSRGSVLVIEDLHWADEGTLDVLMLLARRVTEVPMLIVASYRDDELDRTHPLRLLLGQLATSAAVTRLAIEPLSAGAVAELAESHAGIDAEGLFRLTAGNPFFVTEALAAGTNELPATVRDAVLARAARLSPGARTLLEAVAVVPPQADLWLLERLAADSMDGIEECLRSGMLTPGPASVAFRHELARMTIEESLTPDRALALHTTALESLADPPPGEQLDLARLAHHASAANDHPAVLRFAPQAADRAAAVGAHREAATQYLRAAGHSPADEMAGRADLLEKASHEYYLSGQVDQAVPLATQAASLRHEMGDPLREGDSLRELSHILSFVGRPEEGAEACRKAIALLEPLGPSPELAMAYATLAQRCINWEDIPAGVEWGTRARDMAGQLGEPATLAHALTTLAGAEFRASPETGIKQYEHALDIARAAGLDDHVARVSLNVPWMYVRHHRFAEARVYLDAGLDYAIERGLEYWRLCLVATRAWVELASGDWSAAAGSAASVVNDPRDALLGQQLALVALGLVRARRGDPGSAELLDEALARGEAGGELQQIALAALAKAEAAWLDGQPELAAAVTERALALAMRTEARQEIGDLIRWRRRLGLATPNLELEPVDWAALGCPYEAALAKVDTGDAEELRQALAELQQLGAKPAAAVVTRRLRELGAKGLPRGPRPKTRENEAGLTPRELEVLELLAEGLRNVDIAQRLFVSEKTVDHHVSSILRKLDARTRGEASIKAVRLGLAGQDR